MSLFWQTSLLELLMTKMRRSSWSWRESSFIFCILWLGEPNQERKDYEENLLACTDFMAIRLLVHAFEMLAFTEDSELCIRHACRISLCVELKHWFEWALVLSYSECFQLYLTCLNCWFFYLPIWSFASAVWDLETHTHTHSLIIVMLVIWRQKSRSS